MYILPVLYSIVGFLLLELKIACRPDAECQNKVMINSFFHVIKIKVFEDNEAETDNQR